MGAHSLRRSHKLAAAGMVSALIGSVFVWSAASSQAVHDNGMFELDGNIAHDAGTTPPYDWASLFDASGNQAVTPDPNNGPLLASGFVTDSATPDTSYFATSNKDGDPIASWQCGAVNNATNKDDLLHAYAALVKVPQTAPDNAGHTVLYIASERDTNDGDAYAGFWLLKDSSVGCTSGGFSGHHTDGDLLIVSNYTNGGGTQAAQVYRWSGNDATGSLVLQANYGLCGASPNDAACAIANASASINAPWSNAALESQTFVEAGIDMTTLLGDTPSCFTSFMAETRTSQTLDAQLKDFASGQFNTCPQAPIETTATPGGTDVTAGSPQHDVATLSAVGGRPVPTGSVAFFLCTPAQVTAAGCESGKGIKVGDAVVTNGTATSPTIDGTTTPGDSEAGTYCWRAEYTPNADSVGRYLPSSHTNADTECFVVRAQPTIATTIGVKGDGAETVGLTTLTDSATLSGFAGDTDGETITFKLFTKDANCTGDPVFTTTGTLSNGVATTSAPFTPAAAGGYVWVASYPGDELNKPVTEACGAPNEQTTLVGATISVSKTANPGGPVSAGDTIGFDITMSNTSQGTAANVTVDDNLPAGAGNDLNWALDPAFQGCGITGGTGSQTLHCAVGDVPPGGTVGPIHVTAVTTPLDCATVPNTATVGSDNAGTGSAGAQVVVNCPTLALTKTADSPQVPAGSQIGFTVTVTSSGPGVAHGVTLSDPLPSGSDVDWSLDNAPEGCAIDGAVGSQVLTCTLGDLAAGSTESVHVVSDTTVNSCQLYPNVATVAATNGTAPVEARATTNVVCVLPTTAPPRGTTSSHGTGPLAITGAGKVKDALAWGIGLLALGSVLVALAARRRQAH